MIEYLNLNKSIQNFNNKIPYNISAQNNIMVHTFNNFNNKRSLANDYTNNNLNNNNNFINYTPIIQERQGNFQPKNIHIQNNKKRLKEQRQYSNYSKQNKYNNERQNSGGNNFNIKIDKIKI